METDRPTFVVKRQPPLNLSGGELAPFHEHLEMKVPEPEMRQFRNVRVSGMGILGKGLHLLPEAFPDHLEGAGWKWQRDFYHQPQRFLKTLAGLYLKPSQTVAEPALWVTDTWADSFFFWMTEVMPRLLYTRSQIGSSVPLYLPQPLLTIPFIRQSLEMLGETPKVIPSGEIRHFKKLHVPLRLAAIHHFNPEWMQKTGERLRESFSDLNSPHRKINISRRKARRRKLSNQDEIENLLDAHGFENVVMEDLDFTAQTRLAAESKIICGLHGAGLSHMLSMPPGGTVIEIHPEGSLNFSFFNLSSACQHRFCQVRSRLLESGEETNTPTKDCDSGLDCKDLMKAIEFSG